jgi:glycosyltransferase involved in cell wall biosynthesis
MKPGKHKKAIAILADLPVWTIRGNEQLRPPGHYATWLEPLLPAFEAHGDLDIHWITFSKYIGQSQVQKVYGQTVHILPRRRKMLSMVCGYIPEILSVRGVLKSIQPDLVHAWGSEDVYGLAGAFSGIPKRLFTLQGCLKEYLRLLGGSWLFRLQAFYETPAIRHYAAGTAESPAARDLMQAIHPSMSIQLVDYGVHPDFFAAEWNPSPTPEIVFVGGISKRKGILDIAKVAGAKEFAHIRFRIIGEGDLLGVLKSDSSPNIEWLGKCDRQSVIRHLSRAWCLLMPTYSDTGPTVVKEARVIGLPVITTTGAGAACYIENAHSGYVIEPGNLKAIADSIARICKSRDHCMRMGRHHWEQTRHALHPSVTASEFVQIYQSMFS